MFRLRVNLCGVECILDSAQDSTNHAHLHSILVAGNEQGECLIMRNADGQLLMEWKLPWRRVDEPQEELHGREGHIADVHLPSHPTPSA